MNAIVPEVELLMAYQERDLEQETYSLLFAPNRNKFHDTRYTNNCLCPKDTGHPIRYDGYAACIPGIDSRATPSPITPTTPIQSDFDDDDESELMLTPASIPDDALSADNSAAKIRGDHLSEGDAEVERARKREDRRMEVQKEEAVAVEIDKMPNAAPGTRYKRKRDGRQMYQSTSTDNAVSDEVVKKTGPDDRRRRAKERDDKAHQITTSTITPVPTPYSAHPKNIAPPEENRGDDEVEGSVSVGGSSSRAIPGTEMRRKVRMDIDFTGTWVEGLDRKTDSNGHVTFMIQNEKTSSWAWRYPCLQRAHRDMHGQECRRHYAQHKDLVRHVVNRIPVACDKCGAILSRQDAISRHKRESCEGQDIKVRRPGR